MERSLRPWLDNDALFNLTALGRENRQCVKVLHDFTNQVRPIMAYYFLRFVWGEKMICRHTGYLTFIGSR